MELSDAAQDYGVRGWAVFPLFGVDDRGWCRCGRRDCARPGKHPLVPRGLHEATTDPATIAGWWRRWSWANVGLATGARSGFVAIDVDRPAGFASLQLLQEEREPLPLTLQANTGGGGLHLLYAHPGGLRNSTGRLAGCEVALPNIDLRADGGALVAPPSLHASGRRYQWADPSVPLAPARAGSRTRPDQRPSPSLPRRRRPAPPRDTEERPCGQNWPSSWRPKAAPATMHSTRRLSVSEPWWVGESSPRTWSATSWPPPHRRSVYRTMRWPTRSPAAFRRGSGGLEWRLTGPAEAAERRRESQHHDIVTLGSQLFRICLRSGTFAECCEKRPAGAVCGALARGKLAGNTYLVPLQSQCRPSANERRRIRRAIPIATPRSSTLIAASHRLKDASS